MFLRLDKESATQDCWYWTFILDNGKTNKCGKKTVFGGYPQYGLSALPFWCLRIWFHYSIPFAQGGLAWPS
jgi:hypothetical protein